MPDKPPKPPKPKTRRFKNIGDRVRTMRRKLQVKAGRTIQNVKNFGKNALKTGKDLWKKGIDYLKDAGAIIKNISLEHTMYALPAYYIVAPAEASSNLARYDGGRYADILLNGDIHQVNADNIGISRKQVKTVTYAFLYGASAKKVGTSYDPGLSEDKAQSKGKEIKQAFIDAIPGLDKLVKAAKKVSESGKIRGIDGRYILVDKQHKSLNFLLQGSAATIAKRWLLITCQGMAGIKHERYAFVHDEQVLGAPPSLAPQVAEICKDSALKAGEYYKIRLPIAADANIGTNWSEVH